MGEDNPNAEVEANLLTGEGLYASAGSAFQQIKSDLDALATSLQPAWIGVAYGAYMQKQGQLAKAVQAGSDVMQKGSVEIRKMYDAYMQADEKMREAMRQAEAEEFFMDVLMIITALLGVVAPLLELADLAFEAGMEAIDETVTVVGNVTGEVVDDTATLVDFTEFGGDTETLVDVTEFGGDTETPVDVTEFEDDTKTLVDVTEFEDDTETLVDVTEFGDLKTKLEELLSGKTTATGPDEVIAPQEPVQVYTVQTDDPIIFTNENGSFFVDGERVTAEDIPDDLAGFDPGRELNPPDDAVYDDHEFDNFDFNHEEASSFELGTPSSSVANDINNTTRVIDNLDGTTTRVIKNPDGTTTVVHTEIDGTESSTVIPNNGEPVVIRNPDGST